MQTSAMVSEKASLPRCARAWRATRRVSQAAQVVADSISVLVRWSVNVIWVLDCKTYQRLEALLVKVPVVVVAALHAVKAAAAHTNPDAVLIFQKQ
jgi:hypothetical protein